MKKFALKVAGIFKEPVIYLAKILIGSVIVAIFMVGLLVVARGLFLRFYG